MSWSKWYFVEVVPSVFRYRARAVLQSATEFFQWDARFLVPCTPTLRSTGAAMIALELWARPAADGLRLFICVAHVHVSAARSGKTDLVYRGN